MALFKSKFQLGNKERLRCLTAEMLAFSTLSAGASPLAVAAAVVTPSPVRTPLVTRYVTVEGVKMYCCWTHGLSRHSNHTSLTCLHKVASHQDNATAFYMRGGNNTVSSGRPRQLVDGGNATSDASK